MGGSAFAVSLAVHAIFIIFAIFFLYKWISPPAEKVDQFVPGGGGGGNGGAEASHKIQKQMKSRMTAPTVAKRITSSSSSASFSLPDSNMEMMNSGLPMDVGTASAGSGGGAGGGHGTGIGTGVGSGSGPGSGPGNSRGFLSVSPFGSSGGAGLVGHYYDLKFDASGKQITDRWTIPDLCKVYRRFFNADWNERILAKYQRAPNELMASQIAIPAIPAEKAPTYFGAKETQFPAWCVHYKGTVIAPDSGTYRFVTTSDDAIAVRFNNKQVMSHHYCLGPGYVEAPIQDLFAKSWLPDEYLPHPNHYAASRGHLACGSWFTVRKGDSCACEILIMETGYGGANSAIVLIQKKGEEGQPLKLFRCTNQTEDPKAPKIGNPVNIPSYDPNSPLWEAKQSHEKNWASGL